jgi:hypothetical protein
MVHSYSRAWKVLNSKVPGRFEVLYIRVSGRLRLRLSGGDSPYLPQALFYNRLPPGLAKYRGELERYAVMADTARVLRKVTCCSTFTE